VKTAESFVAVGVTGKPVLHSLSPVLMKAALAGAGLDGAAVRLAADSAGEALALAGALGLTGFNVTAPFKEAMAAAGPTLDGAARAVGSVNTVYRRRGRWRATTTDPGGVAGALAAAGVSLRDAKAAVAGAGGAARAAAYALSRAGAAVTAVNRTDGRARELAGALGVDWAPWKDRERVLADADVVVYAVPASAPVDLSRVWRPGQVLLDANYPASAAALKARNAGVRVLDGEAWLVHQGVPAYEIFTAKPCPPSLLERALKRAARPGPERPICLVGFMGAGKSTAGKILARKLGRPFLDLDEEIERGRGRSIPRIFAEEGERVFRDLETAALRTALEGGARVLACGGGVVLRKENRTLLGDRALTVWLFADAGSVEARTAGGGRPLLEGGGGPGRIAALMTERRADYLRSADLVLDTGTRTPEEVAEKIHEETRLALGT